MGNNVKTMPKYYMLIFYGLSFGSGILMYMFVERFVIIPAGWSTLFVSLLALFMSIYPILYAIYWVAKSERKIQTKIDSHISEYNNPEPVENIMIRYMTEMEDIERERVEALHSAEIRYDTDKKKLTAWLLSQSSYIDYVKQRDLIEANDAMDQLERPSGDN